MRKRYFLNFFFLAFVFTVITININYKIKGLQSINNYEIETKCVEQTSCLTEQLSEEKLSSESDLFLDTDEVVEVFNSKNNTQISLTKEDVDLMAKVVFAESKGEPFSGKVAVASVILNRVMSSNFPDSVEEVIKQKNAFSCVKNGEINVVPNSDSYKAVIDALKGNDPTSEALYFYNPKIATCSWMKDIQKSDTRNIGQHVFFNIN